MSINAITEPAHYLRFKRGDAAALVESASEAPVEIPA